MENGEYAKTDIVKGYLNERRWKPLMRVGNLLGNLFMKSEGEVNADSYPELLKAKAAGKKETEVENAKRIAMECL
jgi:hypothetical protein